MNKISVIRSWRDISSDKNESYLALWLFKIILIYLIRSSAGCLAVLTKLFRLEFFGILQYSTVLISPIDAKRERRKKKINVRNSKNLKFQKPCVTTALLAVQRI